MTQAKQIAVLALRMGDSDLLLAQRLCEWCGKGPAIEEDMAMTNTALDLLGQARLWLSLAAELEGAGRDEDALAFGRAEHEFCHATLTELPNVFGASSANTRRDAAYTLVRQFLFDSWHYLRLQSLQKSTQPRVADIANKALKEVAYHLRRSCDLLVRLGDGTSESHARLQTALDQLWPYTGGLFEDDALDRDLAASGVAPAVSSLQVEWLQFVSGTLAEATLQLPSPDTWMHPARCRTEHLGYLLAEMQHLQRANPGAQW